MFYMALLKGAPKLDATRPKKVLLLVLLLVASGCSAGRQDGQSFIGSERLPTWKEYCDRQSGFAINYPTEMELTTKTPQALKGYLV